MKQNKALFHILIILFITSCIKPFDPALNPENSNKYVIDGMVNSVEGWQVVKVSTTSSTDLAEFLPLNGCELDIMDDQGNSFSLEPFEAGKYRVWMSANDLQIGRSYRVRINLPNGEIIESLYDKMPSGPEVGEVYYEIKEIPTNDPDIVRKGIQFYTDFSTNEGDASYYRWKTIETYEYHSDYALQFFYDENGVNEVIPIDSSKMYCWRTEQINEVFTLSIVNLSGNSLNAFPLNFVSNRTARLKIMYSLFVEQYAISENAFNYWDKLRINLEQEGGLYTTQPLRVKGNLQNITRPDMEVLGFFQANTLSTQRIFVDPVEGLEMEFNGYCNINPLKFGVEGLRPEEFPAYLFVVDDNWVNSTMTGECVDCTLLGGVTIKPDYWPN